MTPERWTRYAALMVLAIVLVVLVWSYCFRGAESAFVSRVRCADFRTQPEAQAYFERYAAHQLDGDSDSRACEGLP